jgi:transcriptional regulator with XRE-family HTH domain
MEPSEAVRELRTHLGESQQAFSNRLGLSIATIVKYEAGREPTGRALLQLAHAAREAGRHDLASIFMRTLVRSLGLLEREYTLAWFDRESQHDPPHATLLLRRIGAEESAYLGAVFDAFVMLRSGDPAVQDRARRALSALRQAMEERDAS